MKRMEDTAMQTLVETLDPARITALNAVLGVEGNIPQPFAHQTLFWDAQPADKLGRDGHPKTGDLIPDMGLPRRMWAGGALRFHGTLEPGREVTKTTQVLSAIRKEGRSGPLGFVTLNHLISQSGKQRVEERQDLVYRENFDPNAPKPIAPRAPSTAELRSSKKFTTTELFRYSALTHNGHRIHYDRDYARDVEGYEGLVVHGPLLAQHLMLMAQHHLRTLTQFEFRANSPLMDFEVASFCATTSAKGLDMWVAGPDGRQCMQASAQ